MSKNSDEGVLDWDDLSQEDQIRAEQLMNELNNLFKKYSDLMPKEDECKNSNSTD
jgi:hypothetical protein